MTVVILAMAATAHAQVMPKNTLTLDGAKKVSAAAMAEAKAKNAPGAVIAVVDDGGNLMALERLDGTFAAGAHVSMGKARTAVQFKRPTRFFEELINLRTLAGLAPRFSKLQHTHSGMAFNSGGILSKSGGSMIKRSSIFTGRCIFSSRSIRQWGEISPLSAACRPWDAAR